MEQGRNVGCGIGAKLSKPQAKLDKLDIFGAQLLRRGFECEPAVIVTKLELREGLMVKARGSVDLLGSGQPR